MASYKFEKLELSHLAIRFLISWFLETKSRFLVLRNGNWSKSQFVIWIWISFLALDFTLIDFWQFRLGNLLDG
jgi:hypothetical protein